MAGSIKGCAEKLARFRSNVQVADIGVTVMFDPNARMQDVDSTDHEFCEVESSVRADGVNDWTWNLPTPTHRIPYPVGDLQ